MLAQFQDFFAKLMAPRPAAVSGMPKQRRSLGLELLYYGIVLVSSAALSKLIIDQLDPFGQRKARQKVRRAQRLEKAAQHAHTHQPQSLLKKKELHRRLGRWVDTEPYEDVRKMIIATALHCTDTDGCCRHGHQPGASGRHAKGCWRPAERH